MIPPIISINTEKEINHINASIEAFEVPYNEAIVLYCVIRLLLTYHAKYNTTCNSTTFASTTFGASIF